MKTKKQQELIDSFLDILDNELGSLYQEIVMCLSELGYYPRKQRSYIVFKHDLHNKEMAKMGTTWTKDDSPYFALNSGTKDRTAREESRSIGIMERCTSDREVIYLKRKN